MSMKNIVPSVCAAQLEQALKELLVFEDFCNTTYSGEISEVGDSVRIGQVMRPEIHTSSDGKAVKLDPPDVIDTTSITMNILQQSWFNYAVTDLDKAQAKGDLKAALKGESAQGVANEIDRHIAATCSGQTVKRLYSAADVPVITKDNVLEVMALGQQKLFEKNVPANEVTEFIMSPRFHTKFRQAYTHVDTDNSALLKKGLVSEYSNMQCKLSNNIVTNSNGAQDYLILRTKKSVAFARQLTVTEALRSQDGFNDVLRSLALYQSKVIRPEEIIILNVKYE